MSDNLTDDEMATLEDCQTAAQFASACKALKAARGGKYPQDWWPRMMASGAHARINARWGADDKIHVGGKD